MISGKAEAQSGLCDPTVPFFTVNLTGQPAGTWISPLVVRRDLCCGQSNPDRCIEFEITLDPGTVALNFYIASGAIPPGAMYYQINCGPPVAVGTSVCLTGPGPHTLTFCKPGNNPNTYGIFGIPAPSLIGDNMASQICPATIIANGYDISTLEWTEITSGTGLYNSYLSDLFGEDTIIVTPGPGFPPFIDIQVCGDVLVPECYASIYICDTFRVYFYQYVTSTINPNPANYCQSDMGVLLTGNTIGGIPPFNFEWHAGPNGTGPLVGTGNTYFATSPGIYSFVVMDSTYPHCPNSITNVPVTMYPNPGLMLSPSAPIACYGTPVNLTASGADNYVWSPAIGLSSTTGSTVTAIPPVTTTYTIVGWNNGPLMCADTLYFTFTVIPPPNISAGTDDTICRGSCTQLNGTGGMIYQWTPTTGLSNPNVARPNACPLVTTTYTLTAWQVSGQLICNGDFSLGNTCFSTQYTYSFNLWPEGYYYVGNNPNANHGNWAACADHTPTADNMMMIVNGAPIANQQVWCQTVSVTPNTTYAFSTWVTSVHPANPARLQFSINGTLIGAPFNASNVVCQWDQFFAVWNSGANTTAQICIVNQNIIRNGNDFALDDINFSPLCENTDYVTVYVSDVTLNISGSNVSCYQGNDGTATVSPSGGYTPYNYQWSNGDTTQNITGLVAGTYCVTVTDAINCTETACITITQPTELIATETHVNVSCFGGNNGSIDLTVVGGVAPYIYQWSNGPNTQDISNLPAGTYCVTVEDMNNCVDTLCVTITQPPQLTTSIGNVVNVACFGDSTGSVEVFPVGGTPPYSYQWSNGAITSVIINLPIGTYTVTVIDSLGCTSASNVTITQPPLLQSVVFSTTNVSCFGGSDGTAEVLVVGGVPPYVYLWSNGDTTGNITGLASGTYIVTVTDMNGCTTTSSATITQPTLLISNISSITNVSCFSGSDGSSTVQPVGGTPPYSYQWSNGDTTSITSGLIAGTYCVTVTDNLGCTTSICATITEPTLLTSSISNVVNVSCFGENDGSATVSGSGGNPPYWFEWSTSWTDSTLINAVSGTYTVTVTDANGCTTTNIVTITQPPLLVINITSHVDVSCFGGSDAQITTNTSGGTPPYDYLWNSGQLTSDLNNIPAGTYIVTVTDDHGCTATATITITQPTLLTSSISASGNVSCFGGNDGWATVLPQGGTPPYSYDWSNGDTTSTTSGLIAGNYSVTITDNLGCTSVSLVTITEPTLLTSSITAITNVSCFGFANGSATVTPVGGTPPYQYDWSDNQTNQTAVGLIVGTYWVTVTDSLGCTSISSVTITQPNLLTSSITSVTNVSCFGFADGIATVTAVGGTLPYSYLWSNGDLDSVAGGLVAGTYSVLITDSQGCTSSTSVTITQPMQLLVFIGNFQNVSCFGGNDGNAITFVVGGTLPYSYLWSNGDTNAVANNLSAGVYTVTVTDNHNCTATTSVTITEPTLLTSSITGVVNVSCFGGSNATATVVGFGGTPPYDYEWSNGDLDSIAGGLIAGTYTVTVSDDLGCTTVNSITITEPTLLVSSIGAVVNVSCFGFSDGSAQVIPGGGTPPYTYLWSNNQTTQTAINLIAGTYYITVTDSMGCTVVDTVTITEPPLMISSITSITNVSCFGGSDGITVVSVGGGTPPYQFVWSNGDLDSIAGSLIAGTYTVTVTDDHGCSETLTAVVTEPTLLVSTINSVIMVSCFGSSDATATVTPSGGTPPYTYLWSNLVTDSTIINVAAGTYTVVITDALGCTTSNSVAITEPTLLTTAQGTIVNVSCFSFADGSAQVIPGGGTPPYTYLWSDNQTTQTGVGLVAGTYTVVVTDSLGCTAQIDMNITEPPLLESNIISITNVSCFGGSDGIAIVLPTGGTPPYSYLWNNGDADSIAGGLAAGTYDVLITDDHGCTTGAVVTITEPTLLTTSISNATDITCFGYNNGSTTVQPAGGTPPYYYQWSNGDTTQTINNLFAGTYYVTVTDGLGCLAYDTITLNQPTPLDLSITSTNVSCFGWSDASATVSVTGSVPPYTYLWSNGDTNAINDSIPVGTYTVTVTDSHNCFDTNSVTITGPTLLIFNVDTLVNVNCFGENNGYIDMFITGGTLPYTYIWNTGASTEDIFNLYAGSYNVLVTDANGCQAFIDTVVTEPPLLTSIITGFTNVSCFGWSDGEAIVTAQGGTLPYYYLWNNGDTTSTNSNLVAGTYTVTITDDHGCTTTSSITITQPVILTSSITSNTNVSCNGGNDGNAAVTINGGTQPYNYQWSNGATDYFINGLIAGIYYLTVTDALGCLVYDTVTIAEPPLLISNISSSNNVSCFGLTDGSATVVANGGTPPYTYQWSTGGSSDIENNLGAGTYTVTVTDDLGCTAESMVTITEPLLLQSSIGSSSNVSCFGGYDGYAQVIANGGTLPYTYLWSNGSTSDVINGLIAGTYTVTVTDDHGCTATSSVTITQPTPLITSIVSSTNVSCFGGNDGTATVSASGSVPPYIYQWSSGGNSPTENGLAAGTYWVTVTDNNGCTSMNVITITQPALLTSVIGTSTNVNCFGENNGSATVVVNGGTLPYDYQWTNGDTTAIADNLVAGNYSVLITDALGCTTSTSVNITQPTLLTSVFNASQNVSCFGGSNGSAVINGNGGSVPYTYLWSNGTTTPANTGLVAGTYTVTVTDDHGCTTTNSITINQPPILISSISTVVNASCFGFNNGEATVSVGGGTQPYYYDWSNGDTTQTAVYLYTGTYSVTITDNNGCTSFNTVTINQPDTLVSSIASYNNISCFGGNNGTITVGTVGGTPPYSYNWSNGDMTSYIYGLMIGTYIVTVTDALGCLNNDTVTLTQPPLLVAVTSGSNVTCFGTPTGSATVLVSGGTPPYSYYWVPSGNTPTIDSLIAGTYDVTVVDSLGCSFSSSYTVNQPTLLQISDTSTNATCYGYNDGTGSVTVWGGTPPYTYQWSTGQTITSVDTLYAGTYTVTATDSLGCEAITTLIITEPDPLVVTSVGDDIFCISDFATISATATGGTPPYNFGWNNGLGAGETHTVQVWTDITYTVTVTDANGCTAMPDYVTLNTYPALNVVVGGPTDICDGDDAILTAIATGGNGGPYIYTWNQGIGAAIPPITVTPYQNTTMYIVGVADGCGTPMAFDTIFVNLHPKPESNFTVDSLYGCEPFNVHFTSHDFPPLEYYWDFGDPFSGANNNSTLASPTHFYQNPGNYTLTLTVTDPYGCTATYTYDHLVWLYTSPVAEFSWSPNPVSIEQPIVEFYDESYDALTWSWCFGDPQTGTLNFSDLQNPLHNYDVPGTYDVWLVVENEFGCIDSVMHDLTVNDLYTFYAPNAFTPNGDGVNDFFIPQSTNLDYSTFEFYVYDRWGEEIYHTTDPNDPWDGRAKSSKKLVQQDVYTWFVYVSEVSSRKHQFIGHVTVIR